MANNYYFKVNKGLSLTPQTSAPTNPKKGDLYFDDNLNLLQAYDGTSWNNVGGGGATLTIGTGLTGSSYDGTAAVIIAVDTNTIATNNYVDTNFVELAGDTMTGDLTIRDGVNVGNNAVYSDNSITASNGFDIVASSSSILIQANLGNSHLALNASEIHIGPDNPIRSTTSSNGTIAFETANGSIDIQGGGSEINIETNSSNIKLVGTTKFIPTTGGSEAANFTSTGLSILLNKTIKFYDLDNSNYIEIKAPSNVTPSDYTITLPAAAPAANTYLNYDGTNYVWSNGGWSVSSSTSLTAGGTVSISLTNKMQAFRVASSGGAVTLSITPFGVSAPANGTCIRLMGTSDTNTVTISNNNASKGCILNGTATLGQYDTIELQYNSDDDRYVEVSRNF